MAFAKTWNNDFHIKPTGSDLVGQVDNFIVETRQAVEERVNLEHHFDRLINAEQGAHRQGSARVWVSEMEPTSPVPDNTNTGASTNLYTGRLWVVVDGSNVPTGEIKVHNGSSWVSCGSFAAAALLAAIKTVDGAGSGLDADLLDSYSSARFILDGAGNVNSTDLDTTTTPGTYKVQYSGYTTTLLVFGLNAAGSVGTVQFEIAHATSIRWRNKTDGTNWAEWRTLADTGSTVYGANHVPTAKPDSTDGAIWVS